MPTSDATSGTAPFGGVDAGSLRSRAELQGTCRAPAVTYARQDPVAVSQLVPEADAQFWRELDDPVLHSLVENALHANHDIRIALSRYEQASALSRERRQDYYPTLGASGEISTQRASAAQAPDASRSDRDNDLHSAGLSVIWELDFFGRVRRSVESQRAETEASAADRRAYKWLWWPS